jgi:DNA polymerase III alpha subunit
VKGLSRRTLASIIEQRRRACFEDLDDFMARSAASEPEATALILCGALDDLPPHPRPARLWRLRCMSRARDAGKQSGAARLPFGRAPAASHRAWKEFGVAEQVRHELETLDVAITTHPVAPLWERLQREGRMPAVIPASRIDSERPVAVAGIIATSRRVETQRGELMLFLTLEDPTGLVECTLFPPVYRRFGAQIRGDAVLMAEGTVEAPYGAPTVTVERLEPLV